MDFLYNHLTISKIGQTAIFLIERDETFIEYEPKLSSTRLGHDIVGWRLETIKHSKYFINFFPGCEYVQALIYTHCSWPYVGVLYFFNYIITTNRQIS